MYFFKQIKSLGAFFCLHYLIRHFGTLIIKLCIFKINYKISFQKAFVFVIWISNVLKSIDMHLRFYPFLVDCVLWYGLRRCKYWMKIHESMFTGVPRSQQILL